ncbi:MAG: hypothetical protein PF961_10350 [Planctomycetota bacterium]|jgi:3-hydroxymyristoyl/3-hydroxydecanoyl-(acyl carrier protein) dehydratase/predicted hotdog family 3-hydroxylacyl-ACP dehydratase|nr:hypothetical protein [Planctomycetota bacterium]
MTESTVLSHTELEAYLPHRGCNLLLDDLTINADSTKGVGNVCIAADDPHGRSIFGRDDGAGNRCWQEPFLAEILALAGVSLLKERLAAEGKEGVYSAISRVKCHGLARMDIPLEATAIISRDRGGFTQFTGGLLQDGRSVMEGEFMSGRAPLDEVASKPAQPGDGVSGEALTADFGWKDPRMCFVDDVRSWNAETGEIACGYTYPVDHPFVPGHFPNAALMMGVTQWLAIADAAVEAATRLGTTGDLKVSGAVKRATGNSVVDVRDLVLGWDQGVPVIRSTNRIAFREPVRPGDGLIAEITAVPC